MKESFVQTGTVELLKQLSAAIQKKVMAVKEKIACVTSWDPKTDKDTPNTVIDGSQIKAVEIPPGIHGQISLKFIMQDGKAVYSQMGNIKDACGDRENQSSQHPIRSFAASGITCFLSTMAARASITRASHGTS